MTEKLEKTIREGLVSQPIEIQNAVKSSNWEKITEEVGGKFYLSENDINILQLEVGLVLLGYKTLNLLAPSIESSVVIDENSSVKMAKELDERIFTPIEKLVQSAIKENIKKKIPNWDQRVNFITSGGDYSNFIS